MFYLRLGTQGHLGCLVHFCCFHPLTLHCILDWVSKLLNQLLYYLATSALSSVESNLKFISTIYTSCHPASTHSTSCHLASTHYTSCHPASTHYTSCSGGFKGWPGVAWPPHLKAHSDLYSSTTGMNCTDLYGPSEVISPTSLLS